MIWNQWKTSKQIMKSRISWSYEKSQYYLHNPGSITVQYSQNSLKMKTGLFPLGLKINKKLQLFSLLIWIRVEVFLVKDEEDSIQHENNTSIFKRLVSSTHYAAKICLLPLILNNYYPKVVLLLRLSTVLQSQYYTLSTLIKTYSNSDEVHVQ